ncbi:MAG: glycosyltransferase family 2 protein [Nitrospinae bacterium]|nr:glycosyltransferase family 2 protein [Nitrospinota bacterium]
MSRSPIVSVVIPAYNHGHFLKETLDSVVAQTFTDWEAIVVNNFSEDDTISIVESFADPRIRLENFRNNGIIGASRNRGVALARGKYVAFLDSDDAWYPEKLARCMEHFKSGAELVCHGLRRFGEQERDLIFGPEKRATFEALLFDGNCLGASAVVVLKEKLELVAGVSEKPSLVTAEDYHLWIKLAKAGVKMRFIKEMLGRHRFYSGSQSGAVLRHMNAELSVLEDFLPPEGSRSLVVRMRARRRRCLAYYGAGRAMHRKGQFAEARSLLFRAVASWPFYFKAYVAILLGVFAGVFPKNDASLPKAAF